jgi:hypothetical protein
VSLGCDGHAWAKHAIEIEVHGLYGASIGRDEADEDIAGLHGAHTRLRILRAAVVANQTYRKRAADVSAPQARQFNTGTMRVAGCLRP